MDIIYYDDNIIVAIKPAGVISTDEPGGMPSLLRQTLGTGCIRGRRSETKMRISARCTGSIRSCRG